MSENPEVDSPETSVPVPPDPSRADQARKGLLVFFALAALGSGVFQGLILRSGKPIGESPWLVYGLMWTPGIASIVARLVFREGFRDVSFRIGGAAGWKAIGLAWLLPPIVGFVAYGAAWATGLAPFEIPALAEVGLSAFPPAARFGILFALSMTLVSRDKSVAICSGSAAFLAPPTVTSPKSGVPPTIERYSFTPPPLLVLVRL